MEAIRRDEHLHTLVLDEFDRDPLVRNRVVAMAGLIGRFATPGPVPLSL